MLYPVGAETESIGHLVGADTPDRAAGILPPDNHGRQENVVLVHQPRINDRTQQR